MSMSMLCIGKLHVIEHEKGEYVLFHCEHEKGEYVLFHYEHEKGEYVLFLIA